MQLVVVWHGAVVRSARAFLRDLAGRPGVDLTLIAPTHWSTCLPRPLRFESSHEPFEILLYHPVASWHGATAFSLRIGGLLNHAAPDAILAIEEPYSLLMYQIARWKRRCLRPPFLACFSYQNICKRYPFPFGAIERRVLAAVDLVCGSNPEVVEVLRRKGFTGPTEVLATPIDVDLFAESKRREGNRRPTTGFQIGYVGRLVEEKGVDTLITAVGKMTHPADLLVVGSGPDQPRLQRLAAPLGNRIRFAGAVSGDEVARVYSELDVLVLPSRTRPHWKEQFGRVLVEAMASGVPVVGSDSGAIPWVIGDAGLVFSEGQADELAARLDHLAQHPELREALRRQGSLRAAKEFSATVVADRIYELLSSPRPPQ